MYLLRDLHVLFSLGLQSLRTHQHCSVAGLLLGQCCCPPTLKVAELLWQNQRAILPTIPLLYSSLEQVEQLVFVDNDVPHFG